jgi:hypothetical protein
MVYFFTIEGCVDFELWTRSLFRLCYASPSLLAGLQRSNTREVSGRSFKLKKRDLFAEVVYV